MTARVMRYTFEEIEPVAGDRRFAFRGPGIAADHLGVFLESEDEAECVRALLESAFAAGAGRQSLGKDGAGSADAATREDAVGAPAGSPSLSSAQPAPSAPAKCDHVYIGGNDCKKVPR